MRFVFRFSLLVLLVSIIPQQVNAWGTLGHRIVGEIADQYLTAKAKAEIKKILGNESVALSSTWADFIKSDTSFRYLSNWHYINFPPGLDYTQMKEYLRTDTTSDAYTRLQFLIKELKKKNLDPSKKKNVPASGDPYCWRHSSAPARQPDRNYRW
jgi:hypothetical protein